MFPVMFPVGFEQDFPFHSFPSCIGVARRHWTEIHARKTFHDVLVSSFESSNQRRGFLIFHGIDPALSIFTCTIIPARPGPGGKL